MSFNPFQLNLTGVEPLGAARGDLPDGGINVRTGIARLERGKKDPTTFNLVVPTTVAGEGGELDGSERDIYLVIPNGKDEENDKFFARKIAGLLRSIGQPTNGAVNISAELISNKVTHIQVTHSKDEERNENLRFITAEEYTRTHWRKKAGSTSNGKGEALPLTQPVPMAMAPQIAAVGIPQVQVPTSPAMAPMAAAPQLVAPVAAPGNLGGFFNAPPQA